MHNAQQRITADKNLRYASPKSPSASFICKALYAIAKPKIFKYATLKDIEEGTKMGKVIEKVKFTNLFDSTKNKGGRGGH